MGTLSQTAGGAHVWAERYDRELADVFDVQDEITGKIVGALAGGHVGALQNTRRQHIARKRPNDLTAYDLVLQSQSTLPSIDAYLLAKQKLERALQIDPNYAVARHAYAWHLLKGWIFRFDKNTRQPPQIIKSLGIEAARLDPNFAYAHDTAALGYFFDANLPQFDRSAQRAFELAPVNAEIFCPPGHGLSILWTMGARDRAGLQGIVAKSGFGCWLVSLRDAL